MDNYVIPFHGLKEGLHEYKFEAKTPFFEFFDNPDVPDGDLDIELSLIRKSQFLELNFIIKGTLQVVCDRCLDEYDQEINTTNVFFIRFGDDFEEISDDVIIIPRDETRINIAQYIYEFAVLALPVRKIHPNKENGESGCDEDMIKKLNEHSGNDSSLIDEEAGDTINIDPRWEMLKKLKDLN
jgi:uncharacterized metal-binding protein YceD (DUF177 family)